MAHFAAIEVNPIFRVFVFLFIFIFLYSGQPGAKNIGTHPDDGRALGNGHLQITRHTHGQGIPILPVSLDSFCILFLVAIG